MTQRSHKRKLRNYLINKDLQLKIVLLHGAYMVVTILVALGILFTPFLEKMFFCEDLDKQYEAAQTFLVLAKRMVPMVVVLFFLVFVHQMLFTHRIFGPLVNFAHTFKSISEGDFTRRVNLRKKDYLRDEAGRINEMLDGLSRLILTLHTRSERLADVLKSAKEQTQNAEECQKIDEALGILKEDARLIALDLGHIKVEKTNPSS